MGPIMAPALRSPGVRRSFDAVVARVDEFQQRRRRLALLVAVGMRYHEDRGRRSGALLSYYGFMSLFPLLLVAATVLGIALQDSPTLRDEILDTVYARIPVIGDQLRLTPPTLEVNSAAAVVALLVSLWSGLAVVRVAEDALHLQWGVPRFQRPGFVRRQVRALAALAVVGLGIVAATVATNLGAFLPDLPTAGPWRPRWPSPSTSSCCC
jgi:membrane protein